jgi:hypothetical protein
MSGRDRRARVKRTRPEDEACREVMVTVGIARQILPHSLLPAFLLLAIFRANIFFVLSLFACDLWRSWRSSSKRSHSRKDQRKTVPKSYSSPAKAMKEGVGRNNSCPSPSAPASSASTLSCLCRSSQAEAFLFNHTRIQPIYTMAAYTLTGSHPLWRFCNPPCSRF